MGESLGSIPESRRAAREDAAAVPATHRIAIGLWKSGASVYKFNRAPGVWVAARRDRAIGSCREHLLELAAIEIDARLSHHDSPDR